MTRECWCGCGRLVPFLASKDGKAYVPVFARRECGQAWERHMRMRRGFETELREAEKKLRDRVAEQADE